MGTEDRKERYLPWANDALIPGESVYAMLNKLAWFSNRGPLQLVRDLKATEKSPSRTSPISLHYDAKAVTWNSIAALPNVPRIHGFRLDQYVRKFALESDQWEFWIRENDELRFCPDCILLGMHFEVLQLKFVDYCPRHGKLIVSHCNVCGHGISYSCNSQQGPFSCDSCNASLLRDGLDNLRDNYYGERRQIARAYVSLVKKISVVPHIFVHSPDKCLRDYQRQTAHKRAMARIVDGRLRGSSHQLILGSPYVAIKVERGEFGKPRLKRLTDALLALPEEHQSPFNQASERRLAQLRVGAWALQVFGDHLACISAGRELLKGRTIGSRECVSWENSRTCSLGFGFAAWETGRSLRLRETLNRSLWDSWGLDDRYIRMFAFYALEKACLGSAVMRFVHYDQYQLNAWQRNGFPLPLAKTKFLSHLEVEQAVIWVDFDQIDFADACHLCDRNSIEKMQRLEDVIRNAPPHQQIQSLLQEYGAKARLAESGNWMHEEINRRARLTLKSSAPPG